jgi:hypothetical protein
MKFLNVILAIYILVLSVIPCADSIENLLPTNSTTYIHSDDTHSGHNHENESCDLCSPFCVCACCGGFSTTKSQVIFFKQEPFLNDKNAAFSYSASFISNFTAQFWNPPKGC